MIDQDFERRLLEQNIQTAQVLGGAIALRDHDTGDHNLRVALYAGALGEELGLDRLAMRDLIAGAFLHDIGKIAIPDRILLKPGPLSCEEAAEMRRHSELGAQLLDQLPAFRGAVPLVRHHHERFDGTGYPLALAGEAIPFLARVFSVVDVFDALTTVRPYKPSFGLDKALEILDEASGSQFDPAISRVFSRLAPELFAKFSQGDERNAALAELRLRHFGV